MKKNMLLFTALAGYAHLQCMMQHQPYAVQERRYIPIKQLVEDLQLNPAALQSLDPATINTVLRQRNNNIDTKYILPEQITAINAAYLTPAQLHRLELPTFLNIQANQLVALNVWQLNQISLEKVTALAKHDMEKIAALGVKLNQIIQSETYPPMVAGPESKIGELHSLVTSILTDFVTKNSKQQVA